MVLSSQTIWIGGKEVCGIVVDDSCDCYGYRCLGAIYMAGSQ